MINYEPTVTKGDIHRIRQRLDNYTMDILHDDGLYRHLHCYWDTDPYGANNCSFHVYTAPYTITILGDWMDAYTLCRDEDMLDFCHITGTEYTYWAGKLQNTGAYNAVRAIDENEFLSDAEHYLREADYGDDQREAIIEQMKEHIVFADVYGHPLTQLLDMMFTLPVYNRAGDIDFRIIDGRDIFNWEHSFGEHYTREWIRTCEALRWAANTYFTQQRNEKP